MNQPKASSAKLNDLMRECFRLNRGLLEAAQRLTEGMDITGAQWGVLTALGHADRPGTVAETARRMGLARQSVQRVADLLVEKGLLQYLPNPDDKRSKLAVVTELGEDFLTRLQDRQQQWVQEIVGAHKDSEIVAATRLLGGIRKDVELEISNKV
jgi:DNA-binding MarR family transcriptional regulator